MQLSQINVGRLLYPIADPRIADFVNNLDAINALAESSPGFVWRLKDDGSNNATAITAYEDPSILMNMSVWASPETLYDYVYADDRVTAPMIRKQGRTGPWTTVSWDEAIAFVGDLKKKGRFQQDVY